MHQTSKTRRTMAIIETLAIESDRRAKGYNLFVIDLRRPFAPTPAEVACALDDEEGYRSGRLERKCVRSYRNFTFTGYW